MTKTAIELPTDTLLARSDLLDVVEFPGDPRLALEVDGWRFRGGPGAARYGEAPGGCWLYGRYLRWPSEATAYRLYHWPTRRWFAWCPPHTAPFRTSAPPELDFSWLRVDVVEGGVPAAALRWALAG